MWEISIGEPEISIVTGLESSNRDAEEACEVKLSIRRPIFRCAPPSAPSTLAFLRLHRCACLLALPTYPPTLTHHTFASLPSSRISSQHALLHRHITLFASSTTLHFPLPLHLPLSSSRRHQQQLCGARLQSNNTQITAQSTSTQHTHLSLKNTTLKNP